MRAQLASQASSRQSGNAWQALPRQAEFLSSRTYEALYGGAAGGGKSEALLVGALRWVHEPSYRALLLRRTFPDLQRSLIDRSQALYRALWPGAEYNVQTKQWRGPSGAIVSFGYCALEKDVYQYQGAEFQHIGFDELTHFSESQYTYLLSRARSAHGLPIRIRAATNPGGEGHEWVMRRWGPWLDPENPFAGHAEPGKPLHYLNGPDGEIWVDGSTPNALSRVFVPATLADNPHLGGLGGAYAQQLQGLDAVTRAQLLTGNWLIKPAKGLYFKRGWFEIVGAAPANARRVRYWDRAATTDGDWTVGVRMSTTPDKILFVEDVVRFRGRPAEVMATILQTAKIDGGSTVVAIEQDPGQAGVFEADAYVRELQGFNVRKVRPTGDKVTRAQPVSAQAEARNIKLVAGDWNAAFLSELEGFPEGSHDDQVDAFSGAFNALVRGAAPSLEPFKRFQKVAPRARE